MELVTMDEIRKDETPMPFAKLLQDGYMAWLAKRGTFGTQADFALYLGVSPVAFNRHYNGRTQPHDGDPVIEKYAAHLGDAVYDALGLSRKSKTFLDFQKRFDATAQEDKEDLLELIDKFLRERGAKRRG